MIRVQHLRGAHQGKVESFEGAVVRIGRRPECDVRLDPERDRSASGVHAELRREGGRWFYVDCDSSNGSFSEGRRVDRIEIRGGERIEIGRGGPLLGFELDGSVSAATEATPSAAAQSGGASRSPGNKTVAMMIQAALSRTRDQRTGKVPTAAFVRQVASEAVRHSSRTFKVVVVLIVVGLGAAVAFLVVELQSTKQKLDEMSVSKLGPAEIGEFIADNYGPAIYLLVYRTRLGYEQGYCTGFAVGADRLLTNAHCVAQMESLAREGASFFAMRSSAGGEQLPVVSWSKHSGYDASSPRPTADAGLLRVGGAMPVAVGLAEERHLAELRPGSQIFVFGFPGDLSDVRSPVATLTEGVVGRLTALDGQVGTPQTRYLLQYSAFTSKGTSGSPVFDKHGRVVAVNSGYYQGESRVRIENPATGRTEEAKVSRDLSGYSFGIRIDLARQVLQ
jgi:V8-like Glu-specific endopeptidase